MMALLRLAVVACLAARARSLSARPSASARTHLLQVLAKEIPVPERFTASREGAARIEAAVAALEGAATDDERPLFPRDLMRIDGTWELKYTNNSPPPPPDWFPVDARRLAGRDVAQRVDVAGRRLVNCVTLAPWPAAGADAVAALPLVGGPLAALARASVRLELDHAFRVDGDGSGAGARRAAGTSRVTIALERVARTLEGVDDAAAPDFAAAVPRTSEVSLPEPVRAAGAALAQGALGGGVFDTTYCDDTLRVARGTSPLLRELRVFVRAPDAAAAADGGDEEDRFAPAPPGVGDPEDAMPSD